MNNDGTDQISQRDIAEEGPGRATGSRWRSGRRLAAVATGTTIALGAGGIAYAATTEPTPTPSASAPNESTPATPPTDAPPLVEGEHPSDGFGHHGGGMFFGPGGMALHGEQVVEPEDGVYETIATQRGDLDAISDDEITVTSEDGYTRTYALSADSLTSLKPDETAAVEPVVGDEVMLVATVESGTATVTRLVNVSDLPALEDLPSRGKDGPGWGRGGHDGELPAPAPSVSPDAEGSSA